MCLTLAGHILAVKVDLFQSMSPFRNIKQISSISGQVEETPDSMMFYTYLPNEPLSKERVEAFSDGVYAIVATLLILDIWFVLSLNV